MICINALMLKYGSDAVKSFEVSSDETFDNFIQLNLQHSSTYSFRFRPLRTGPRPQIFFLFVNIRSLFVLSVNITVTKETKYNY